MMWACGCGGAESDWAEEVLDAKETVMMVLDNRRDIIAWYQSRGYAVTHQTVLTPLPFSFLTPLPRARHHAAP